VELDPIQLTAELVKIRTTDSAQKERECIDRIVEPLAKAGFQIDRHSYDDGRENLVARLKGTGRPPLCFTGHVDTVPFGTAPWNYDPLGADVADGRLYGRGTSDMKGGVAAFVSAACASANEPPRDILLIITTGEEIGCRGAAALVHRRALPQARALVVAEPTDNGTVCGHKGALWLKASFAGKSAHGAMPHLGVNAAYKAARAIVGLEHFAFDAAEHPMGRPTLNVGTVHAGININSVPDRAEISVDIRSVPTLSHQSAREQISRKMAGCDDIEELINLPPVWTDPGGAWIRLVADAESQVTGRPATVTNPVNYFTDAAVLAPALGNPPVVITGPGDPTLAHQIDEYCRIDRIKEAREIYFHLMRDD
jgi:succinyl-diaminopimelate desuccinylase